MSPPSTAREFAADVVSRLRKAGFQALWAGGCVRDLLLGQAPADFDVATDATPDQVQRLFGKPRTLSVGASFGVMIVLGPPGAGLQVEVATFRREGPYSDGRRPDSVEYCSPEEDARRRDFTINGMFYDPLEHRLLDYVGGEHDLAAGMIRAIGDPIDRMTEDKLRMLRAVRFSSRFEFALDTSTASAIRDMAAEIQVVSVERIAQEFRKMLVDRTRRRAIETCLDVGLLHEILPELVSVTGVEENWAATLVMLNRLNDPGFELAWAVLLHELGVPDADDRRSVVDAGAVHAVGRRLRLSNEEIRHSAWLVERRQLFDRAPELELADLKNVLAHPWHESLVEFSRVRHIARDWDPSPLMFVQDYLAATPRERIDPAPLLTGDDLCGLGHAPGPNFKVWLDEIRRAQLNETIFSREDAILLLSKLIAVPPSK